MRGIHRGFAWVSACACLALAGSARAQRKISLDDIDALKGVSDARISPDGAWVAYTVEGIDAEDDATSSDLWMASWDGRQQLQLTRTPKESESDPRWSPDGRWLAFLADRGSEDGSSQVWLLDRSGGEAQKLTEVEGSVSEFAWSPDAKRLALIVADPEAAAKNAKPEKDAKKTPPPIVIDRYQFKEEGEGYLGNRHSHLYVFEIESRTAELLTPGSTDELLPAWSPDGSVIAFASKRGGDPDRHWNWDLFVIDARAGATARALTTFQGEDVSPSFGSAPVWSPDGRSIAYLRAVDASWEQHFYGGPLLAVVSASGGEPRLLTADLDRHAANPHWSADGRSLYFLLEDDRSVLLARVPAAGGKIERLSSTPGVIRDFDIARSGRIAVTATRGEPDEVFALEGRKLRPLSHQNRELLAAISLGSVSELDVKSADGTAIGAMVVKPPDFKAGHRYPTILMIHGGPVGQDQHEFDQSSQWFAAHGYVVVQPNYRGSSGRGFAFSRAIATDWGHLEVEDVLAAVDALVAQGVADRDHLVIGGWSYGAMTTDYTIARDTRFKAAVSGAGIANQLTGYGTDEYVLQYETELGVPWKNIDTYLKVSYPFFHADRITTPTLFVCGDQDADVPLVNSEQMYQALRSLGRDTRLVIYPGQGHSFATPSYERDLLERWLAWYDTHLAPQGASAAEAPKAREESGEEGKGGDSPAGRAAAARR